jgi:AmiR/NasT family two-component response regulator
VPTVTGQPRLRRVLLARLSPLAARGMRDGLVDGVEIVGEEDRYLAVESVARSLAPDAVVLARESEGSLALCERIRLAVPAARVILWQEHRMGVIDPGAGAIRWVPAGGLNDLHHELVTSDPKRLKE